MIANKFVSLMVGARVLNLFYNLRTVGREAAVSDYFADAVSDKAYADFFSESAQRG